MDRPRVRTEPIKTTKVLEPEEVDFRTREKVKRLEEELNDPAVRAALPANKLRSFEEEVFDPDPELVYAEQSLEEIDRLKAKDYLEPYERMGEVKPRSQIDLLYDQYERLLDEGRGPEADELMDRIRRLEGN
jgi:DnaJ-domain-containing protein 1